MLYDVVKVRKRKYMWFYMLKSFFSSDIREYIATIKFENGRVIDLPVWAGLAVPRKENVIFSIKDQFRSMYPSIEQKLRNWSATIPTYVLNKHETLLLGD